ncbi:hypothetical protein QBC47DRAFT_439740 [Echria macrotheca]|uniref:Uncharacterized protein n=1 Tax=Echria macrotheca TaxID=438768 RepID=A0AAJ0B2D3_9PEZI|nr:hypothetical protein QBC47DRAFT_439740 [Echria macrotheca]
MLMRNVLGIHVLALVLLSRRVHADRPSNISRELQAICMAHGKLQLVGTYEYGVDPMTAFELLNVSQRAKKREIEAAAENTMAELSEMQADDMYVQRRRDAIVAAHDLLVSPDARTYYEQVWVPQITHIRLRPQKDCAWMRLIDMHACHCVDTWPTIGLVGLIEHSNKKMEARPKMRARCLRDPSLWERVTTWWAGARERA